MNNKEILDNAPCGATHVDNFDLYWNIEDRDALCWQGKRKSWLSLSSDTEELRSLADIKRIVELEEQLQNIVASGYLPKIMEQRILQNLKGGAL